MRSEAAWVWLLLPLLLGWVWWLSRRSYAQLSPVARWFSAVIRAVILLCLVAALARPVWLRRTDGQHLVFLLDASRSISQDNLDAALKDIDHLAKDAAAKSSAHRISLIAFGRRPRLLVNAQRGWTSLDDTLREQVTYQTSLASLSAKRAEMISAGAPESDLKAFAKRIADVEAFRDQVAGDQTDVQGAIRLALNAGTVGEARSIYLFTDANFNRGEWKAGFDAASAAGSPIHTVALDRPIPPEVAAADLTLPPSVRVNQGFSADLRIASTVQTSAKVVVYKDGYASGEFTQSLHPGENAVRIPGLFFRDKGFHQLEVAVRAEPASNDTRVENNTAKALVVVPGELRVLYVDSDEAQQSYLTSALGLEGVQVEARPASGVPQTLEDLLSYDAFILCNVPADRLTVRQMQLIKTYVQDFGGGFAMLGGDQSFGLGGYYNTPIEEILPVRMPIQKDLTRPSLAIVLVIDKSGSMEGVKMQLAKRAAVATAEAINPRDQIAVVGFDSDTRVILDLTPAGDSGTINAQISSLDAGGGTYLFPAMEAAHNILQQSNARRKHVIILTDGMTEGFGYPDLAQMMAAESITISAVGIGEDADMKLLEQIAAAGGGRSYFTNDFYSIPQIFTREALRASNSMLVERLVLPTVANPDECLGELDGAELPTLAGYVATTPREAAKTIIISDAGDPILAKWRTGLGRTVAFTSDAKPRWADDWIRWPDFAKFWAQVVRTVAGHDVARDVSIEARQEPRDDGVRLTMDLRDASGNFVTDRPVELTAFDPTAGAHPIPVQREAPGLFSATVPQGQYGKSQQFAWRILDPRAAAAPATSPSATSGSASPASGAAPDASSGITSPFGFVYSFSPEFRTLGPDEQVLSQIRTLTNGDVARVGDAALKLSPRTSTEELRLWPLLLGAGLLLVPLDILIRRLG